MTDLAYCIENFHKPRMTQIAQFLLEKLEFPYDFFEPPTFETYMVQIKLPQDLIISVNYFSIELSDDTPYLFLQLHCLLGELQGPPGTELLKAVTEANNATELSQFHVADNQLFLKSVLIDDPGQDLDIAQVAFQLQIFHSNLLDHGGALVRLI